MPLATALLIIGLLLMVYGADRLVFTASTPYRNFGTPPIITGTIVVSMDTSSPEIVVFIAVLMNGQPDLAVGTVIGSNTASILFILGLLVLIHPSTVHSDVPHRELPLVLPVSILAVSVPYDGQLGRSNGSLLLFLTMLWLLFIAKIARLAERQDNGSLAREQIAELSHEGGLSVTSLWLGIVLITMPITTHTVVDNVTVLANYFAMSELTTELTMVAIGTSLPELTIAIAGPRKGENDIAVDNIIGANIFNIVVVLGLPALITSDEVNPMAFTRDYSVMLLVNMTFVLLC